MELEDIEISPEELPKRLCRYCRSEIDRLASVCPHCRRDQRIDYRGLQVAFALLVLGITLWICGSWMLGISGGILGLLGY